MEDFSICPICGKKLSVIKLNRFIKFIDKTSCFLDKKCVGVNHFFQIFIDQVTKKIDYMKFSLYPTYSQYVHINFIKQYSNIYIYKNGEHFKINIPRIIDPDFPNLIGIKEKINKLLLLS